MKKSAGSCEERAACGLFMRDFCQQRPEEKEACRRSGGSFSKGIAFEVHLLNALTLGTFREKIDKQERVWYYYLY